MRGTIIALSLVFGVWLSSGCNRAKDEVLPDGTKLFGHLKLKDGTKKAARVEYPDGGKLYDVTWLPDGNFKAARMEFPDGERKFDMTALPDGTEKAARVEYLSEGMVKKDKDRPKPKVAHTIEFLGLRGGEPRPQVEASLRKLGYAPLACEYKRDDVLVECSTSSVLHKIDLMNFVHGRLSSFRFHYPANEHDELYQKFEKELGDPTDFAGKKGSELFTWDTENTVPCSGDPQQHCPATALMLSPADDADGGTIHYFYTALINVNIEERAKRMIRAANAH